MTDTVLFDPHSDLSPAERQNLIAALNRFGSTGVVAAEDNLQYFTRTFMRRCARTGLEFAQAGSRATSAMRTLVRKLDAGQPALTDIAGLTDSARPGLRGALLAAGFRLKRAEESFDDSSAEFEHPDMPDAYVYVAIFAHDHESVLLGRALSGQVTVFVNQDTDSETLVSAMVLDPKLSVFDTVRRVVLFAA